MYDVLSRMYEGKNINRNMNLRNPLKGTKMRKGESIQDYFTSISQIKENLSAIGYNLDEDELVMPTLHGLTRPWDSFIQTMCTKKESMKFDIVWEDCIQEEVKLANREALLREDDQDLASHTKEIKNQTSRRVIISFQRINSRRRRRRRITQSINATTVIR